MLVRVAEHLELPGGTLSAGAVVQLELIAATTGRAVGHATADGVAVIGRARVRADAAGVWTAELRPNTLADPPDDDDGFIDEPDGTRWAIDVTAADGTTMARRHINVTTAEPDAENPDCIEITVDEATVPAWKVIALNSDAPGALPAPGTQAALDALTAGKENVGVAAALDLAKDDRVQHRRLSDTRLRNFTAALAGTGDVDIAVVPADSVFDLPGFLLNFLAERLAARFPGMVAGLSRSAAPGKMLGGWTTAGGTTDTSHGLGGWAKSLTTGQECDLTATCVGFEVYVTMQETGGANLEIYVDDVLEDTVSTTDAGVDEFESSRLVWTSDALDPGSHELRVVADGAGTAIVDHAVIDRGGRIRLHNGGHSGWATDDFIAAPHAWRDFLANVEPDLVVMFIGLNDRGDPVAEFEGRLVEIVDDIRALSPASDLMVVIPYGPYAVVWDDFAEALGDTADYTAASYVDLYAPIGNVGTGQSGEAYAVDELHPSTDGGNAMADMVASVILGGAPDAVTPLAVDGSRKAAFVDVGNDSAFTRLGSILGSLGATVNGGVDFAPILAGLATDDDHAVTVRYLEDIDMYEVTTATASDGKLRFGIGPVAGIGGVVDNPVVQVFADSGHTQPVFELSSLGLYGGAGDESALDVFFKRDAAGRWRLTNWAGTVSRLTVEAPVVASDAARFQDAYGLPFGQQLAANGTFAASDVGRLVTMSGATDREIVVPPSSSVDIPALAPIAVSRFGTGELQITPGSGVSLFWRGGNNSAFKVDGQYGLVWLRRNSADLWIAWGDVIAV